MPTARQFVTRALDELRCPDVAWSAVQIAWGIEHVATGKYVWAELTEPDVAGVLGAAAGRQGATTADDVDVEALLAMFNDDGAEPPGEPQARERAVPVVEITLRSVVPVGAAR